MQLTRDQGGLDGFADTHVVGNEQAHRIQAQGHQQWYELVRARLNGNVAETAEWTGTSTQSHAQGVGQQNGVVLTALLRRIGCGKMC
ncbi:hypothetical protein [Rhodanobacter lindaniclasticus]